MSEPTLIQEQRAILRRLRQTMAQHTCLIVASNTQERSPDDVARRMFNQVIAGE